MPNYDITPDGASTPKLRLYDDSLTRIPRGQENEAQAPTMEPGAAPVSEPDGVAAAGVTFRGIWLGTAASTLADRLRTILSDESVGKVTVDGVDDAGNSVTTPYDGTYTLSGESRVEQKTPADDRAWEYEIILSEA